MGGAFKYELWCMFKSAEHHELSNANFRFQLIIQFYLIPWLVQQLHKQFLLGTHSASIAAKSCPTVLPPGYLLTHVLIGVSKFLRLIVATIELREAFRRLQLRETTSRAASI